MERKEQQQKPNRPEDLNQQKNASGSKNDEFNRPFKQEKPDANKSKEDEESEEHERT